jgi:hypothetical protein
LVTYQKLRQSRWYAARIMLPDLRFDCIVLKININVKHHRHTETKTIVHGSKFTSKRKSKLGFPLQYYSNNSHLIKKIFRHLACFICVLLVNFGFKVCVDATFNIDDKCVFISGLWFRFISGNSVYNEDSLYKYVTKRVTHGRSKINLYILLTVHLLVGDQLDAQFFYIIRLFQSSTRFEQTRAHQ